MIGDPDNDLSFTPVAPCRIVDTRAPGAGGGFIPGSPGLLRRGDGPLRGPGRNGRGRRHSGGGRGRGDELRGGEPAGVGNLGAFPWSATPSPGTFATMNYSPGTAALADGIAADLQRRPRQLRLRPDRSGEGCERGPRHRRRGLLRRGRGAVGPTGPTGPEGPDGRRWGDGTLEGLTRARRDREARTGPTGPTGPTGLVGVTWQGKWDIAATCVMGNAVGSMARATSRLSPAPPWSAGRTCLRHGSSLPRRAIPAQRGRRAPTGEEGGRPDQRARPARRARRVDWSNRAGSKRGDGRRRVDWNNGPDGTDRATGTEEQTGYRGRPGPTGRRGLRARPVSLE